jgi:predicted Zn-dependent protease
VTNATLADLFDRVADVVADLAAPDELLAATLEAEASDFMRFNCARLRQAGRVERAVLRLRLVRDERQTVLSLTLPGLAADHQTLSAVMAPAVERLRTALADSAPDPLLDVSRGADCARDVQPLAPFDADAFVDAVSGAAGDADLVGFAAAGPVGRGFCNSVGSRLWHERGSVDFDFSIHLAPDAAAAGARKAVKSSWTSSAMDSLDTLGRLDTPGLVSRIAAARRDAALLERPVRRLAPGSYRALLAPRALADLLELLGWGGFSARAHHNGVSPLMRLRRGDASFSPLLSMAEDMDAGFAPAFQSDGYARPRRVALLDCGRAADWLVSPRSSREFGLVGNAAAEAEVPESLSVDAGTLASRDALAQLGTGLAIANFWYLNYSDRATCRATGMTRFATFWVEGGEVVAPVEAMRFDDSLYRILGEQLEALTADRQRMPNTDTYDGRGLGGIVAPGALVSALRFVL